MKRLLLFGWIIVGCFGHEALGQNDFFFNHYMFNPTYFNAAWAGMEEQAFVAAHHRTQWAGYDATFDPEGAPTTQLVSTVIPVDSRLSGIGLSVSNDIAGPLTSVQFRAALASTFSFDKGRVHVGVMPSLNFASVGGNYRPTDPEADRLIPDGRQSETRPNLHLGLVYESYREYFIGLSAENLLEPDFPFSTDATNSIAANYSLFAGKTLGVSRDLLLKPTVFVRSDLVSYSVDISAILEYQEKMWAGISFRRSESLSVMIGYSFLENGRLRAGYSFDYIIQEADAKEPTSHEVFIRFNLPDLVFGGRKAVKTPRFAF